MSEVISITLNDNENIAFLGDIHMDSATPHARLDSFPDTVCEKLSFVRKKCVERNVRLLIIGGDVFNRIQVTNECINKLGKEFVKFRGEGIKVVSIVGNHDISRNSLDTLEKSPLSVLFNFGVIEHINLNRRIVLNKKVLITGVDYVERPVIANPKAKHNILVAHMFYNDDYADPKHSLSSEEVNNLGYDAIFLGHDHVKYPIVRSGKTDVIRSGSLMRSTTHDYNFKQIPSFCVLKDPCNYDTNNWEVIEVECKTFEEVVSSVAKNKKFDLSDLSSIMEDLVVRITSSHDEENYDGVLERVKNDKDLDDSVRSLLMRYFREFGMI